MYFEEIKLRQNGKIYRSYLLRESYRENGKVKHRTLANLSRLPKEHINQLMLYFKGKGYFVPKEAIGVTNSKEYGASYALLEIARQLQMDKMIYSMKKQWREDVLAMIIGRILYQGSKLSLVNIYKDSCLWELCGHGVNKRPDTDKCYFAMDKLLSRKDKIQKFLAKKHLHDGCLSMI